MRHALPLAVACLLALAPGAAAQLPGAGFASPEVEFVRNLNTGPTSGARLLHGFLYVTTGRDLQIYDTTADPENPAFVGSAPYPAIAPAEVRAPHEDPDTNGSILIAASNGEMLVFDVRDKTKPALAGRLAGAGEHTVSCVLDCTYAYGSEGAIVDLRNPAEPKLAGNWYEQHTTDSTHDVTEVAPGIVLTSTEPMKLLDLRADPLNPALMAEARTPGFMHANLWPNRMTDDFLLAGGEGSLTGCPDGADATFMTFDTRGWQTSKTFSMISEFRMAAGMFADGSAPATSFCVHWFDTHPAYVNGGLVAIGWYESGLRFITVGTDGALSEAGYWLPVGARTSAAYWRTDRVLYTADYVRGVDVLRWTGEIPPNRPPAASPPPPTPEPDAPPERAITFDDLVRMPSTRRCAHPKRFRIRRTNSVRSMRVHVNGKRVRLRRGRLRRMPRRRFTVQVVVRTKSGFRTAGQRTYRRC